MSKVKVLRCMIFADGDMYVAACLDLVLASQAKTALEAKNKLESQIKDYVEEAISEPKYAIDLLNKKIPFSWYFKYYCIKFLPNFFKKKRQDISTFDQPSTALNSHA